MGAGSGGQSGCGSMVPGWGSILCLQGCFVALTAPGWSDLCTVLTVGCKDAVESGEVDPGFGDQCGEACNEIQRFEDHMGGAIAPGVLEGVADLAVFGQ